MEDFVGVSGSTLWVLLSSFRILPDSWLTANRSWEHPEFASGTRQQWRITVHCRIQDCLFRDARDRFHVAVLLKQEICWEHLQFNTLPRVFTVTPDSFCAQSGHKGPAGGFPKAFGWKAEKVMVINSLHSWQLNRWDPCFFQHLPQNSLPVSFNLVSYK